MTFPVEFNLFGHRLHPHPVMEAIAYVTGSQLYFWLRRRDKRASPGVRPIVPIEANLWLIVGCVFGALVGAKLLALTEHVRLISDQVRAGHYAALIGGKTIVGGLLGGWIGVELAKKAVDIRQSTGDLFVFPLVLGIAIGRIGCFLTGLEDGTHGVATSLPWAIDFGDGVPRHPTQLYEIGFLILLGVALAWRPTRRAAAGERFRLFLLGYLGFRVAVEFIKPVERNLLGLSAIQWASAIGCAVSAVQLWKLRHYRNASELKPEESAAAEPEVRS